MTDDDAPRHGDETVFTKAKSNQNLLLAFVGGLVLSWLFNGAQGDNTGWMVVGSVVAFFLLMRKTKRSLPTIADIVLGAVMQGKRVGEELDYDPRNICVREVSKDRYVIYFLSNRRSFEYEGKLAKGFRSMRNESAQSIVNEHFMRMGDAGYPQEVKK
jgi:hypothetical protein